MGGKKIEADDKAVRPDNWAERLLRAIQNRDVLIPVVYLAVFFGVLWVVFIIGLLGGWWR